ncbi:MAG TPA: hypothetical protein VM029_08425, partial [Opitutaceae bacterium]|nr:hypothetical protein [Opitutaceae bacterium]
MRTLRALLCLAGLSALSASAAEPAPAAARFSQGVATGERAALGLVRLDSDQLAVLDVMVRRDTAARSSLRADSEAPAVFSQRLTADERRLAGLNALTPEELARLDAAVARFTSGAITRSLLAPPTYLSRASRVEPKETKKEREIHGSFSLSYGWGSGG